MPEGDTVWLTAARLRAALQGRELTLCDLRVPRLATIDLAGRKVGSVAARGKHLLVRVDGGLTLHSHLGMDGAWWVRRVADPLPGPAHEVRAVLETAAARAVALRVPVLELVSTSSEARILGHLGPDLLAEDFDEAEAVRRFVADPARAVAEVLLDQRVLAGVGNVYCSEICFLRGLWPWRPVGDCPDPAGTVRLARRLLFANRHSFARVTTGDLRRSSRYWVYGRQGRPCLRCGTAVVRVASGPAGRVVYLCPACQG